MAPEKNETILLNHVKESMLEATAIDLPLPTVTELRSAETSLDPDRYMAALKSVRSILNWTAVNYLFHRYIRICVLRKIPDYRSIIADVPIAFISHLPEFRASILRTNHGTVICFTHQFNRISFEMFKFVVRATPFANYTPRYPVWDEEFAAARIVELAKFAASQGSAPAPATAELDAHQIHAVDDRNNDLQAFALAHEYAHLILGHLESAGASPASKHDTSPLIRFWEQMEQAADRFAVSACKYHHPQADARLLTSIFCFFRFAQLRRRLETGASAESSLEERWRMIARDNSVGGAPVLEKGARILERAMQLI